MLTIDVSDLLTMEETISMDLIGQTDSPNSANTALELSDWNIRSCGCRHEEPRSCEGCSGLCMNQVWGDLIEKGLLTAGILARRMWNRREAFARSASQRNSTDPTSRIPTADPWEASEALDPWSKKASVA